MIITDFIKTENYLLELFQQWRRMLMKIPGSGWFTWIGNEWRKETKNTWAT